MSGKKSGEQSPVLSRVWCAGRDSGSRLKWACLRGPNGQGCLPSASLAFFLDVKLVRETTAMLERQQGCRGYKAVRNGE